ncbi:MAG: M23 family peptidase, partial [Flavobacteriaceae bacterium]|nr:M23 family peptidase [Flavobacteriaceae bacterium]
CNGIPKIEIDFKRFSFSETKHLNRLIDYKYFKTKKSRIQKLFIEPNNPLSLYKNVDEEGYLTIENNTSSIYKIKVKDFKGNLSTIQIPIQGIQSDSIKPKEIRITENYILASQPTNLKEQNVSVYFPDKTFYDDFFIDFKVNNDTLTLHKPVIPAQKYFYINFDISHYKEGDKENLFIGSVSPYKNKLYYSSTTKKGNIISTSTKSLGTYTIGMDLDNPKIKPLNFQDGKWLSKYRFLKLKISDKTSGIKNYRATVNGKWILMEYDYKKGTLTHDFNDQVITDTKNNLKVIVTDNVGNSSTFEITFYRK